MGDENYGKEGREELKGFLMSVKYSYGSKGESGKVYKYKNP